MTSFSAPRYAVIDKVGMPHVMNFIVKRLTLYNTADLDWLKLLPLNKKALLHGECMFPYIGHDGEREHGFRIRASVNIEMCPPFQYEHWARIPNRESARGWKSGEQVFYFADLEECAVHTLAHECFHFLSETSQVPEKNSEANANWWADGWLAAFRLKQGQRDRPLDHPLDHLETEYRQPDQHQTTEAELVTRPSFAELPAQIFLDFGENLKTVEGESINELDHKGSSC